VPIVPIPCPGIWVVDGPVSGSNSTQKPVHAPIPSTRVSRRWTALALAATLALAACGSDDAESVSIVPLGDAAPGASVGLLATEVDGTRYVEWLDRLARTILRLDIDSDVTIETVASLPVGTDGEQRGLRGQVTIDGRRFLSWTQPDTFELVVGELLPDGSQRIVWSAGEAGGDAIGGVLDQRDGQILLGLGRNTEWDAAGGVGGAILLIDPDGTPDQQADELSVGYTNPWAFAATGNGSIWVADNAAGPDPDDESRDNVERIGRADLEPDRNEMREVNWPGRAPAAMVKLPDGRIGICGFLDNELRAYDIVDDTLERAGTIIPCLTGAAVFADGTVATIAQTDTGMALHLLRP
jgi:hypothetical protein